MLTDTQISTYLIPSELWQWGEATRSDLPPLARPALDALDIERRSGKGTLLRNESHRYILCCERIQGIVKELTSAGILRENAKFIASRALKAGQPSALAYIAITDLLTRSMKKNPYPRLSAIFFPPDDAREYLSVLEHIFKNAPLDDILRRASRSGSTDDAHRITMDDCRVALITRIEVVRNAAAKNRGIVDVVELV
jgi:hypothetical protein